MTTVVNNPAPVATDNGGSMGMIIGIFVLIIIGYVFFMYGLPAIQNIKVGAPQVTIPAKIDVTVNQPK